MNFWSTDAPAYSGQLAGWFLNRMEMSEKASQVADVLSARQMSERERRISQRAYIVIAILITISGVMVGTSGVLGIYLRQLGVSGAQLGSLMAWVSLFGLAGLFGSNFAVKIGLKRMMAIMTIPVGLAISGLLILPRIKDHGGLDLMLLAAFALLAARTASGSILNVPWFPILQMITLPARRGAFIARMRLSWSILGVLALIIVARLLGQKASQELLMVLIGLSGLLFLLLLWPLHYIVEHRTAVSPKAVTWPEAWRAFRANPLFVRACLADFCTTFGESIFGASEKLACGKE